MLSIATWNLEKLPPRQRRNVERELAARPFDVLVLTESAPDFQPGPDLRLVSTSSSAPDRSDRERWVCVWVRADISATPLPAHGEPERSAFAIVRIPSLGELLVAGTVLPWRGDTRHEEVGGGAAFERSLERQSADIASHLAAHPQAHLAFVGDYNQEVGAASPVGTARGCTALNRFLEHFDLVVPTAGSQDPLRGKGWRDSIDHIAVSRPLAAQVAETHSWPDHCPLGPDWPDHHGVGISIAVAQPPKVNS